MEVVGPTFPAGDDYVCMFAESPSSIFDNATLEMNAERISDTLLECPVPPRSAGFVHVAIFSNGDIFSDNTKLFEYVDCTSRDCASCISNPSDRCGWCFDSEQCGQLDTCNGNWSNKLCPGISLMNTKKLIFSYRVVRSCQFRLVWWCYSSSERQLCSHSTRTGMSFW